MDTTANDGSDRSDLSRQLLAESSRLRALARCLCGGDDDRADDLVQETWAIALGRHPAGMVSSLGAWCRGVLRNRFREWARGDHRRRAREIAAARARMEAVEDTAEARVDRVELLGRLVAYVLELDPRYRDVLLERYFEDRSLAEIAARDALPLETIRTRHRRALERLRERLDADAGGDRSGWIIGLALGTGLWPREAVAASAAGTLATLAWGFVAMKKSITVCVLALLFLGGALALWMSWRDGAHGPASTDPAGELAENAPAGLPQATGLEIPPATEGAGADAPRRTEGDQPIDTENQSAGGSARIVGCAREREGGPLAGVRVEAALVKRPDLFSPELEIIAKSVTTTEGEFVLDGLEAGTYFVRAIGARDKPEQIKNLYLAAGEERWVEIVMTRGLAISGRVIEEKGEPIEGATVETTPAFDQQGSMVYGIAGEVDNWAREALRVKTAADGTFRLDRLASGNHRIVVRHPEWAIAVLPKIAASSEDVTIVMARGGSVRGRVLDATGSSLGDAQVALDLCADSLISGRMWRRRYETTTDAEGRFAFSNASVGRSMLEARTDGLPERVLEVDVPDADAPPLELEIRLGASATLRGRVVDADGGVVAEARIWAESTEGILLRRQVDSGDDGTFRVEELERGLEYRLDIRDDRYMRAEPLIIWALKAETDLGDVQLEPGLAIYGRVILAAGDPVSNARVGLERLAGAKNDGSESWGGAGGTTFCDADGRFMLGGLEAGTFRAIVRADGIGIARSERVVLIEGTEAPELRIGMGGGPQVAGQVVDERGFPVAGSRVVIGEYSPRDVAAWSDREGRFRFAHVDLPVIWIRAQLDTFESEALAVVPGETVELVLARMAAIAGVVRDAVSGAPLREFEVHLDRSRGPDYGSGEIFVQPAGQFNLTDVPPGDYILSVHAHGYLGFEADLTLVAAERREIEIPMRPALQLRGRVLDIDGSLLVNAQVTGHIDGEEAPSRVPRGTMMAFDRWGRKIAIMFQGRRADSAVTDRRGEFVLDVPADCELTVLVHTADHLDARLGPLRVADRTLDVGEIRVERGAGCIGTVFLPDGKPRGGGSIRICPVDHQHGARSRYKAIGPDGSFRFSGLEPGRYGIEVFGAEETRKEVELDAAEIAPLELRLGPEHRR